ncbi:hypothetical protein E5288_WYG019939 [Bos mutus]|uniref:Uncharacterized protein n=1 Tax=Bos mutus TaxID=72004 RepID=A0A6B0RGA3_9CETA|nr:hypothetical protein [Bos mutus]
MAEPSVEDKENCLQLEPLLLKLQLLRAELDEQGARTPSGAPQTQASPAPRSASPSLQRHSLKSVWGLTSLFCVLVQCILQRHEYSIRIKNLYLSFTECGKLAQPLTSYRLILIRLPFYGPRCLKTLESNRDFEEKYIMGRKHFAPADECSSSLHCPVQHMLLNCGLLHFLVSKYFQWWNDEKDEYQTDSVCGCV